MVYQPTEPSKIAGRRKRSGALKAALDAVVLMLVAGATYGVFKLTMVRPENRESNNPKVVAKTLTEADEDEEAEERWLDRTLTSWLGTFSRDFTASVEVYDLDNDVVVGELGADEAFEGHFASELGAKVGRGLAVAGQTSARELVEILKVAFRHEGMSAEEWAGVRQGLLAQEEIYSEERCRGYCKVRDGLPAGFASEQVEVMNENYMDSNGSFYVVYRDAAIVEAKVSESKTRSFAVALVAKTFPSQTEFRKLGEMLEKVILAHIRNED